MSKTKPETFSIFQFIEMFPNDEAAESYFEEKRWGKDVSCPHCGSCSTSPVKNKKPMPHRCRDCRQHFSVRTKTILSESKISLQKWLLAIYMLHTSRKGVSSIQMAKELGITQKSAWFLNHRIREAMTTSGGLLGGSKAVEVDEVYIGGKEKNKHAHKKLRKGRGAVGKQAVFGMMERGGKIKAFPITETKKIDLQCAIVENIRRGSTVYSDCHRGYQNLKGYDHQAVAHSVGEYVRGQAHTNGIESFWALLKRGYYGTHHHMSIKHLHRYVNEFSHRHNIASLDMIDCLGLTIDGMINKRLSYNELVSK
ncbi:MAG: IS1595 family transposase [Candidatus Anammoxibacter sp.]